MNEKGIAMNKNQPSARLAPVLNLLAALWLIAACAAPGPAAGDSGLQITLLYDRPGQVMSVRVADAKGAAVTGAVVSVEGNMNHAGMTPVIAEGVRDDADGAADGLYTLPFAFSMLGDWILTVTVEQDGATVKRDIDAQVTSDSISIAGMPAGQLQVTELRARPAPLEGGTGAIYLTVTNGTGAEEQLLAASSPAAQAVELHETVNDNGVMRMMHQPEGFAIPAGSSLDLAPGGKHMMLIGLAAPLAVGDTVELTLTFAQAGDRVFQVPVVEIEGMGQMPMDAQGTPAPMPEHDHEAESGD